jgi:hypothetical protein
MKEFNSKEEVQEYLNHDKIKCLECGQLFSFLPNHLRRKHNLTADEYREKYNLPTTTPLAGLEYRAKHRAKFQNLVDTGRMTFNHLADAVEKARNAGRGTRRDFDLKEQADIAKAIPHEQLPPGSKLADGKDADRRREYQREYRRKKKAKD